MAFDQTNFLENATQANNGDFVFTNRAGTVDSGVQAANTAGEWCEENGPTTSTGTGPSANPAGRAGYIYTESSTPVASTTWAMRRVTSFDSTTQNVFLDLIYNLNAETASAIYIEYATVASPNETTDWTILETIQCTLTDLWISDTFDFSAITTSTLHIRVRVDTDNNFTNDIAFSTWREYSVDTVQGDLEGYRWRNDNGSEATATWIEVQDTLAETDKNINIRLRILTDFTGTPPAGALTLQYKRSDEDDTEWRTI